MFHTALAAKLGLSAIEEKTLDLLGQSGPATASHVALRTGLTRASVTGLLDRLERKGFARRIPNEDDGRSVLVETIGDRTSRIGPMFAEWTRSMDDLYCGYSESELDLILHFMIKVTKRQREAATKLSATL